MSEAALTDEVLIQRAQRGDRSAFDALVLRHQARAYQYAYRLTHSQEDASDVVAEAFVRVFNALPNFKFKSTFSTWLYRILTNCYLDIRKKERNRPTVSLEAQVQTGEGEVERQIESPDSDPLEEAERTERERRVQVAVARLPEYQQAMITMYHGEQMSYEDIAAALDLPIGTVKSRLNRARLSLREMLQKDAELFQL